MQKILVAIDGSKTSGKALGKAKKIGELLESNITIVYVMEDIMAHPYVHIKDYDGAIDQAFKDQGTKVLDEALKIFKDYKGVVETLMEKGSPGNKIIQIAEEGEFDLIVIGSRGLNAISRAMLGSVSNKVVNRANTSVLIVK